MAVNPTDSTPVGAMPPNIQMGEKDPTSIQLAKDMRTKRYGKDVRETMARMIEWTSVLNNFLTTFYVNTSTQNSEYYRQFTDVMKELSEDKDYHSLPEIAGARRGYQTLIESLNNLSVNMINKNLGKFDQTYMTDEFLQQIAGNAPINAVPANGSLTTPMYTDKSITNSKIADEQITVEKLDPLISGFNNYSTKFGYSNGLLTRIREYNQDGTKIIRETNITYDSNKNLTAVSITQNNKTVNSTINYANGALDTATNEMEV